MSANIGIGGRGLCQFPTKELFFTLKLNLIKYVCEKSPTISFLMLYFIVEVSEEKAHQREDIIKDQIRHLSSRLKVGN